MKNKISIMFIVFILFITGCNNKKLDQEKIILDNLSLEEKIAQMLIIYHPSNEYDEKIKSIIKELKPGGFILMNNNISTYDKTLNLVTSMQNDSEIPMIIAIDQEGGSVQRLKSISDVEVTDIPYMYYLGQTNNKDLAYSVGKIMAEQLRTIGVNLTFAPVMDIYTNINNTVIGKRSFGSDVETVYNMATALKKGIEDNGINTCIKHFPGHGATETDSHISLPIVNKTIEELETSDLIPFTKSIKNTNMIMIGHIALPNITRDNTPSSISKEIITSLLKEKYNYQGLVVTDALNMKALTNNYTYKQIYIMAINAGVDLLLMPNDPQKAIDYIKEAIINKEIDENTINESVYKILKYKNNNIKNNYLDKSYLNKKEYENILRQIKVNE